MAGRHGRLGAGGPFNRLPIKTYWEWLSAGWTIPIWV
jgi:hypothetical protein